ncbi:MAG: hemerythrin [Thermotogae bacterium]|nr:hemerythrin [Thermotogota bacterium]
MIVWSDKIATGVKSIDVQHRVLIRNFNDLERHIVEKTLNVRILRDLLIFLLKYAEWHFGNEERCAAHHNCPIAELNRKQHEWYIKRFTEVYKEFRNKGEWNEEELYEWAIMIHRELSEWLINHVIKTDRRIGVCLGELRPEDVE